MFYLTAHHFDEISAVPELLALAPDGVVPDTHMKEFVQLCVEKCCAQTFLHVCKEGRLSVLARFNGVALAQQLDFSHEHPKVWKRAARHAGEAGNSAFIEYIFTQCNTDEIRKSVLTGACMGDQVAVIERFASLVEDPTFPCHLPPLAAQLNAVECLRGLMKNMSPKTWMSTMAVAALTDSLELINLLLDHAPLDQSPSQHWCEKVALRVVGAPGDQRVLEWIFQHTTAQNIIASYPRISAHNQERLTSLHQHFVLTAATAGVKGAQPKRKI